MVERMTDERLAELRALSQTESDEWWGLWCNEHDAMLDIDDLRSLLARLDAAEELLREVANGAVVFDCEMQQWLHRSLGDELLAKCRSYLR